MRIEYKICEPTVEGRLSHLAQEVGLIMLNPAGSSCHEDTGRESQELADNLGLVVVAADRPTSHRPWPNRKLIRLLADDGIAAMAPLATELDKELGNGGYNFQKLKIVGRSAGATGGMELTLTEILGNIDGLYGAEAAGWWDVPSGGTQEYVNLRRRQAELEREDKKQARGVEADLQYIYPFQDYKTLRPWRQAYRNVANAALLGLDVLYSRAHYNQRLVPDYIRRIVLDHGIRTHLDFAEQSMVLPPTEASREEVMKALDAIRNASGGLLSSGTVPRTLHRSFDRRPFFADRVVETLDLPEAA